MNYKNKKSLLNKRAFTLIELLIVIAIIGILFIVLVSKVDFATDKAKATGVQTDFRSFQMAFDTVAKENAGFNTFGWDTGDTKRADFATAPRNNKKAHKVVSKELIPLLGIQLLAILNKSRNSKLPVIQKNPKIPNNRPKSPTRLVTKAFWQALAAIGRVNQKPINK